MLTFYPGHFALTISMYSCIHNVLRHCTLVMLSFHVNVNVISSPLGGDIKTGLLQTAYELSIANIISITAASVYTHAHTHTDRERENERQR